MNDEIEAIVCVALCPEVPFSVREMDYMSQAANQDGQRGKLLLHIQYGLGKEVQVKRLLKNLPNGHKQNFERLVTLSPLTPMATHFHIRNGAKQLHINEETQNFEYKLND